MPLLPMKIFQNLMNLWPEQLRAHLASMCQVQAAVTRTEPRLAALWWGLGSSMCLLEMNCFFSLHLSNPILCQSSPPVLPAFFHSQEEGRKLKTQRCILWLKFPLTTEKIFGDSTWKNNAYFIHRCQIKINTQPLSFKRQGTEISSCPPSLRS